MIQKFSFLLITILLIASVASAGDLAKQASAIKKEYNAKYPNLSMADLKKSIADKSVTLIDANGSDSYADGHIPSAIQFNSEDKSFASKLPADKNAQIVVYCGSERCTAWWKAADWANKNGYTNVKHFSDGKKGWEAAGEKLIPVKK
ncbi:rhodanese-like domain-containing protein [Fibrobacterales bacterium]|nr:rhodanese-like domain-containing protein [Fibrobacterales bacterium]